MPDIELIRRTPGERRAYMQGYVAALEAVARRLTDSAASSTKHYTNTEQSALLRVARDICEQALALAKMTEEVQRARVS